MPTITGIQQRGPFSHSGAKSSDYDHLIDSDEYSIERYEDGRIKIFFRRSSLKGQGVGLVLPSSDVATAFGRSLLIVSEGYSTNITSSI